MTVGREHDRQAARAALAAELEALGEPAPSPEELDALLDEEDGDDVALVARLVEIADLDGSTDDRRAADTQLDQMGQRRAWSRVEAQLGPMGAGRDDVGDGGPAPTAARGGRPTWWPVVLGVAALAAAVLLAVVVVPSSGDRQTQPIAVGDGGPRASSSSVDPAELEALSAQARAGLDALGVDRQSASKRAREMRAEFRAALASEGAG